MEHQQAARERTHLVALTPPTVRPLFADQEFTSPSGTLAVAVRLPDQRETLQSKLRGVREADAPTAHPPALWFLRTVQVRDGPANGSADSFDSRVSARNRS